LIQIGPDEIEKVTNEEKSNIIDFNDQEERVEVPNEVIESWKKNLDSDSDCGVDVLYEDEKVSLLVAPKSDTQTMQQQIHEQYLTKPSSPALRSIGVGSQSGPYSS
jgi:hypothetical protein